MKRIKVLVVDDSAFMRKLITNFLQEDQTIEVIGIARNGLDAVGKSKMYLPDVITMDIEMPVMNGLDALQKIMKENPTPTIMLSSTTTEGAENTILAMQYGAVDFIAKPSGSISLDLEKVKADIISKVKSASGVSIHTIQRSIEQTHSSKNESVKLVNHMDSRLSIWNSKKKKLVCIGTSTGGPRALQEVLTALPETIDAPILIVQHMPAGFTKSLANRLNTMCKITVKEAEDGEVLKNGVAYIAPGNFHMKLTKQGTYVTIKLDESPPRNGHRPSVDVMFESVSNMADFDKIVVILTGMGSDGSKGLVELKNKGNIRAIAESKNSCIVFGMPRSAIATKLVDDVEDIEQVATLIMKYMH